MKTSELTGALLDYYVAEAEGMLRMIKTDDLREKLGDYSPSTKWAHGGPILERERIQLEYHGWHKAMPWCAMEAKMTGRRDERASTPLAAAMRLYVSIKFGDEVLGKVI